MNDMNNLQQHIDQEISLINELLYEHNLSLSRADDAVMDEFLWKLEDVNRRISVIRNRFK